MKAQAALTQSKAWVEFSMFAALARFVRTVFCGVFFLFVPLGVITFGQTRVADQMYLRDGRRVDLEQASFLWELDPWTVKGVSLGATTGVNGEISNEFGTIIKKFLQKSATIKNVRAAADILDEPLKTRLIAYASKLEEGNGELSTLIEQNELVIELVQAALWGQLRQNSDRQPAGWNGEVLLGIRTTSLIDRSVLNAFKTDMRGDVFIRKQALAAQLAFGRGGKVMYKKALDAGVYVRETELPSAVTNGLYGQDNTASLSVFLYGLNASNSVVGIKLKKTGEVIGSGFVIGDGIIITARHVVRDMKAADLYAVAKKLRFSLDALNQPIDSEEEVAFPISQFLVSGEIWPKSKSAIDFVVLQTDKAGMKSLSDVVGSVTGTMKTAERDGVAIAVGFPKGGSKELALGLVKYPHKVSESVFKSLYWSYVDEQSKQGLTRSLLLQRDAEFNSAYMPDGSYRRLVKEVLGTAQPVLGAQLNTPGGYSGAPVFTADFCGIYGILLAGKRVPSNDPANFGEMELIAPLDLIFDQIERKLGADWKAKYNCRIKD